MESSSNPTSNDLLFRLKSKRSESAKNYALTASCAEEAQDIQNAPSVSMGPHLIPSDQAHLLTMSGPRESGPSEA